MWTDTDLRSAPLICISVSALLFVFFTRVSAGQLMDCDGGCMHVCDGISVCLRMFPARHLDRSNSVLITLPLLQSSCQGCTIYFFISSSTSSTQKSIVKFHLWEFVAIQLSSNICKSSRNKWRLALYGNFAACFKVFFPTCFQLPCMPLQLWLKDTQARFPLFLKEQWGHFHSKVSLCRLNGLFAE